MALKHSGEVTAVSVATVTTAQLHAGGSGVAGYYVAYAGTGTAGLTFDPAEETLTDMWPLAAIGPGSISRAYVPGSKPLYGRHSAGGNQTFIVMVDGRD